MTSFVSTMFLGVETGLAISIGARDGVLCVCFCVCAVAERCGRNFLKAHTGFNLAKVHEPTLQHNAPLPPPTTPTHTNRPRAADRGV